MLELIWTLLNISLLIYFLLICLKAIKFIRENLGRLATPVFMLGLLSFISKPYTEDNKVKIFKISDNTQITTDDDKLRGHNFSQEIVLEEKLLTTISATISFKEYDQKVKVVSLYSDIYGFVGGIDWSPSTVMLNKNTDASYHYEIGGTKDWRLLGIRIYAQQKVFKGRIKF